MKYTKNFRLEPNYKSKSYLIYCLKEDTHYFLVVGPLRGRGGGVKPPEPLGKKLLFFLSLKKVTKTS